MSGNTLGKLFTVTSFGESHGAAIGCIVDGCPPGLELSEADLQGDLDRRRPGKTRHTTQRRELDEVQILSGVFEGKTTGSPIALIIHNIHNTDQRSKDYSEIMDRFRPGHADYTYQHKYGLRDYRGGGRSSARETAMRVAAGAIAKKYLKKCCGIEIHGYMAQLGPIKARLNMKNLTGMKSKTILFSFLMRAKCKSLKTTWMLYEKKVIQLVRALMLLQPAYRLAWASLFLIA